MPLRRVWFFALLLCCVAVGVHGGGLSLAADMGGIPSQQHPQAESHREVVCHGQQTLLMCPVDALLVIHAAAYGRSSIDVCPHKAVRAAANAETKWCTREVTEAVRDACESQATCQLVADSQFLGFKGASDPQLSLACLSPVKYLEVDYECVEISIPSTPPMPIIRPSADNEMSQVGFTVDTCHDGKLHGVEPLLLTCGTGLVVHVISARHRYSELTLGAVSVDATNVVRSACDGLQYCNELETGMFELPHRSELSTSPSADVLNCMSVDYRCDVPHDTSLHELQSQCSDFGTQSQAADGHCICKENYYGPFCDVACTAEDTCSGHGACDKVSGHCVCEPTYDGENCASRIWSASVSEGDNLSIHCPQAVRSMGLKIETATYSTLNGLCSLDTHGMMSSRCDGKSDCELLVDESSLPNPCEHSEKAVSAADAQAPKLLYVRYRCATTAKAKKKKDRAAR